jgi:hypothetical protein
MTLDLKKKKLELMRVQVAKCDLEYKIEERLDEIERLKSHVKIQEETEIRLTNELKQMKESK